MKRIRWVLALLALFLPAVAIGVTGLLWRDALPARVASHWSDLGAADDSLPTGGVFAFTLALGLIAAAFGTAIVALPRITGRTKRAVLFWAGFPAGIAGAIWLVPSWLTVQAGSAEQAVLGIWFIPFLLCILYGAVPYAIAPRTRLPDADRAPSLPLGENEVGAWSRTITANLFIYATIVLLALAAVIYLPLLLSGNLGSGGIGVVILLATGILLACFIRLRITVDWRGLRIVSLPLHLPLKRIPLDRIRRAEAAELRPAEWGGWGYRIMPGRSALILRGGPGMVITTTTDKQFAITLVDPEAPAGLLNTLRSEDADASPE